MNALVYGLIGIMRLRSGPEDLPFSWKTTLLIVAGYLMVGVITGQRLGDENSATASLAAAVMQFSAVMIILQIRKFPERLPQTLCALAGTGIMFTVLSFMFLSQADPDQQQPMLLLAWFTVFFWSLMVDAHIYKNAFSITIAQGMLVAVLLLAFSYVLIEFAFKQ
ncbi:MAG: hypothetical protein ACI9H8_001243 [Lysobacterales bacterium]|jgi:hypothetical protein